MSRFLVAAGALLGTAALTFGAAGPDKPKPLNPALAQLIKGSPENFILRFDRNGDGFLTRDELPPRLAQQFDKLDTNGDGKLDRQEVARMLQVLRQRFDLQPTEPGNSAQVERLVDNILQRMDANKDGKISRDEAKNRIAEFFDQFDTNKDGYLDRAELRRVAARFLAAQKANPGATGAGLAGSMPDFDALDSNADGRLTPDELKGTPFTAQFERMDTNKDGKIDRQEFETYFQKRAEEKPKSSKE